MGKCGNDNISSLSIVLRLSEVCNFSHFPRSSKLHDLRKAKKRKKKQNRCVVQASLFSPHEIQLQFCNQNNGKIKFNLFAVTNLIRNVIRKRKQKKKRASKANERHRRYREKKNVDKK